MTDVYDMTVIELVKLGCKVEVTMPPHDKEGGHFIYTAPPTGEYQSGRGSIWEGNGYGLTRIEIF